MYRGRERGSHADPAIAEPAAVDAYGGEEQGQGRRRQNMIEPDLAAHEFTVTAFPMDRFRALHPGHGLAGGIARGGDGHGLQASPGEVVPDAGKITVRGLEQAFQHGTKGRRVHHAARARAV